jgi:hypothetical protein
MNADEALILLPLKRFWKISGSLRHPVETGRECDVLEEYVNSVSVLKRRESKPISPSYFELPKNSSNITLTCSMP